MAPETEASIAAPELEQTRLQLQGDAGRAPTCWRPFFAELDRRLFDPDLEIDRLRQTHGVQGGHYTKTFETAFKRRPNAYVTHLRIKTAARLLRRTRLAVRAVGRLVGIPARSTFERLFTHLEGQSPTALRPGGRLARKLGEPQPHHDELASLERCLGLATSTREVRSQIEAVRRAHSQLGVAQLSPRYRLERRAAPLMWGFARELPADRWQKKLSISVFETPAIFERLRQECCAEEGEPQPPQPTVPKAVQEPP